MAERLLAVTGYLVCQFLLLLLTPVTLVLTLVNRRLRQVQQALEQSAPEPMHIHYEVHQHLHLERPSTYQQVLDQVSRQLPLTQVHPVPVRSGHSSSGRQQERATVYLNN
ncbi:MAG TPA: hypothetical protein V6D23_20735 [Candidatus Obscuribacterales bacterium]